MYARHKVVHRQKSHAGMAAIQYLVTKRVYIDIWLQKHERRTWRPG